MDRILSLSPIPTIVLNPSGTIIQVSRGFCNVIGLASTECIGLKLDQFDTPLLERDAVQCGIQQALADRQPRYLEAIIVKDKFWRTRIIPIFETDNELIYILLEIDDVTKDCAYHQSLREQLQSCETYRLLVDTVKDYAIFLLDSTGHVATWNTGARLLKQYTADEIIGRHFRTFYGEEDLKARVPEIGLEVAVREGKFEDSGWRFRKDGSRFWANVVVTPSYKDNVLVGFTKVTRDLTERHEAEARLVAEYEEASKLKSQFLANMSHEIRSPMHGMISALNLLTETGLSIEQRELAGIIQDSASILLQVINDILDYSKLSSGVFQMNSVNMSIKDTVNAVVRSTKIGLKSDLALYTKIDESVPDQVKGDPFRLHQVLQNIVINAIKFTEFGSVEVNIRLLKSKDAKMEILVEVTDTGVGVPERTEELLFTPFTQLDNSATKRFKGTGLGLSICKSLAELMGGNIGFHPNPTGKGSVFWFTFTVEKSSCTPENHSVNSALSTIKTTTEKHILLVEDNSVNQKVMVKMLAKLGLRNIDVAEDGRQAVDIFGKHHYDLILMDVSMPILDGCSATREIRASGSAVPIIAMTANALKGDAERFIAAGMSDYISKPVDKHLLVNLLVKWLN